MKTQPVTLGSLIRSARKSRHLTLKQLAPRVLGHNDKPISWQYLAAIERGQEVPSELVIVHIAEALGLNPLRLLRLGGNPRAQLAAYLKKYPEQAGNIALLFFQARSRRFQAWTRFLRQMIGAWLGIVWITV